MPRNLAECIAFTAAEAAVVSNVRKARIDDAVRDGVLPTHRIGVRSLILRRDLENFIASFPARKQPNRPAHEDDAMTKRAVLANAGAVRRSHEAVRANALRKSQPNSALTNGDDNGRT